MEFDASISSLFWGGVAEDRGLEADIPEDLLRDIESLNEETERKFLTLSWWLLHLGYKDIGERVRRAVEETLERWVHPSSEKAVSDVRPVYP